MRLAGTNHTTGRGDERYCDDDILCRLVSEVGEIQDSVGLLNNKLREAQTSHQVCFGISLRICDIGPFIYRRSDLTPCFKSLNANFNIHSLFELQNRAQL